MQITKNKEYKNSSNETNEILDDQDEQLCNKKPDGNKEFKDNTEKQSRDKVVKYKMNGNNEWKRRKISAKINWKIWLLAE